MIFRSDRIPNYFEHPNGSAAQAFLSGKVAIFRYEPEGVDIDFLRTLKLPRTDNHMVKKARPYTILRAFQRQSRKLDEQIQTFRAATDKLLARRFPEFVFEEWNDRWRFSLCIQDGLHWDTYDVAESRPMLRMFWNVSERPRLWELSWRAKEIQKKYSAIWQKAVSGNASTGTRNDRLNKLLPLAELDRHFVSFDPLDAWVMDSQNIGHGVLWGDQMVSLSAEISEILDP